MHESALVEFICLALYVLNIMYRLHNL